MLNRLSSTLLSKNVKIKIYRTIILLVILYECETPILKEERKLKKSENRALRRMFGPKRDEGTGEWRKLQNEELNDLYSSTNIIRVIKSIRMRWAGHVACVGVRRVSYKVLVERPVRKRTHGRSRRRWG